MAPARSDPADDRPSAAASLSRPASRSIAPKNWSTSSMPSATPSAPAAMIPAPVHPPTMSTSDASPSLAPASMSDVSAAGSFTGGGGLRASARSAWPSDEVSLPMSASTGMVAPCSSSLRSAALALAMSAFVLSSMPRE